MSRSLRSIRYRENARDDSNRKCLRVCCPSNQRQSAASGGAFRRTCFYRPIEAWNMPDASRSEGAWRRPAGSVPHQGLAAAVLGGAGCHRDYNLTRAEELDDSPFRMSPHPICIQLNCQAASQECRH
ncbi:hypothetical protein MJO28_010011 [Puccinia striiformis f. sp. tritici]|uniref:Uncharacterized protein n=1 Tax=Puccinia striiformis f. sp. tritici TaxID=168172 RepID=A0ACC0E9K8_9BASI|nr:hypothetical protein MJO28_010011 [Puccinia striiformis f. sp. tritici]